MTALITLYFVFAIILTIYGANCHVMIFVFRTRWKARRELDQKTLEDFYGQQPPSADGPAAAGLPVVTTQIPIFNERHVATRVIDAVASFDYPAGRHEIQVLDDSIDDTRQIVAARIADLKGQGVDIHHITRDNRVGYKAGALRDGLKSARGEFTAIFDADFVPLPDFLLKSIPFFLTDDRLGLVQGRWGHLNRKDTLATRLQAIGINGHFMIEQTARNAAGLFLNFNGTAGVFRKQAILEAGNWQDDTLTEDMDLSYRSQLAGWRCRYLVDLVAPAEIPTNINAFKSQQFRWAKGSIQTAIKLLPRIFASSAGLFAKFEAFMHLTHYVVNPLMLILALLALPVLISGYKMFPPLFFFIFGIFLFISCTGPSTLYLTAERTLKRNRKDTLAALPALICFGCGMAVNNSRAVMEAVIGKPSGFIRTPKKGSAPKGSYTAIKSRLFWAEIFIGIWCLAGTLTYFHANYYLVGHFLLLYAMGFFYIGLLSWHHGKRT